MTQGTDPNDIFHNGDWYTRSGAGPLESGRGAMLVQAQGTQTTLQNATSTSLTMYTKILLDTALYDTENCTDLVNSCITVPSWVQFVRVVGHISFPDQNVGAGHASGHLWRNAISNANRTAAGIPFYPSATNADKPTPEAHYHNRVSYPQAGALIYGSISTTVLTVLSSTGRIQIGQTVTGAGVTAATVITGLGTSAGTYTVNNSQTVAAEAMTLADPNPTYISVLAATDWIPVLSTNEKWTLYGWQDTGASVVTPGGVENWLSVQFR